MLEVCQKVVTTYVCKVSSLIIDSMTSKTIEMELIGLQLLSISLFLYAVE